MKKKKAALMVFLIFLFTLCLSGCGQRHVDVQTVLTLKQDHTGNRQIRLYINKSDFIKVFEGTIDQLNEQLDKACPSELEWNYAEEDEQYSYTFTLHFSSLEEYEKKAEKIIGKEASVIMEQPESVFASGLLYREDFDSFDLISWLITFLEQQGNLKEGQVEELFLESFVKLVFDDTDYELETGKINLDTLIKTPVERIDILTHYRQNKHCDRQVIFTFSSDSMNKNGSEIKAYLEKSKPEDAYLDWSEKNGNSLCTVLAGDYTSKQLNHFVQELFGESESFVNVQPQQRTGIFASAADWSELIDVSDFSYNANEKIAVGYYIQWEDGMNVTIHRQNSDELFELRESEVYGGYKMVVEQEMMVESLVTEVSTTYVIEDVEVDTEFHTVDNLTRNIELIFQAKPDQDDQENIRKRIAQKAKGIAEVTNGGERKDGRSSIVISQTGSIDDLNAGYQAIFDVQGQLAHKTGGDLLEFQHAGSFVDLMDFTNFLENDPLLTSLTYHLKLPGGEKILEDTISSTVDLKQGTQEVDGREYTGVVEGAYLSLTLNSRRWNTDGIMLFLLIFGFILAAGAVMLFADFIRKLYEKVKKNVKIFNNSFGKNDDVLEDFPNEEEHVKRRNPLEWKRAPRVKYEEEIFEEKDAEETGTNKKDEGKADFDPRSMVEKVTEISIEMPENSDKRPEDLI